MEKPDLSEPLIVPMCWDSPNAFITQELKIAGYDIVLHLATCCKVGETENVNSKTFFEFKKRFLISPTPIIIPLFSKL